MKITDLKVHVLEWERPPHHWRDGLPAGGPKGRETFLRILTDEGVEGHSTHCGALGSDGQSHGSARLSSARRRAQPPSGLRQHVDP